MKDELDGRTMKGFVVRGPKMYSYLTDEGLIHKKAKGRQKCFMKREMKLQDYKECLGKIITILKSQQGFRSEAQNVFTEKSTKLQSMQIMIREYKHLMDSSYIYMVQDLE